jgi:hypothetical protein
MIRVSGVTGFDVETKPTLLDIGIYRVNVWEINNKLRK